MEKAPRRTLSLVESAKLINLINNEFVSSKLTDEAFAKHATEKLGFEVLDRHVHTRRVELGLPSLRERPVEPPDLLAFAERVTTLERTVAAQRAQLQTLEAAIMTLRSLSRIGQGS